MKEWRFIYSGHNNPFTNMAVDMAMVDIYKMNRVPLFRIYGWEPYSFSIGYFQKALEVLDISACVRDGIPFVRRPTGGGIIYHGDEVTYSIVCSSGDIGSPATVKDGYKILCSFILEAYHQYGLSPAFAIDTGKARIEKTTLCFASFQDYDILINGKKIGGNAQKRHKDIIMQHGSIPLTLDYTSVLKYVRENIEFSSNKTTDVRTEVGRPIDFDGFAGVLKDCFIRIFGIKLRESFLTPEEKKIVNAYEAKLIQEKNRIVRDISDKENSANASPAFCL